MTYHGVHRLPAKRIMKKDDERCGFEFVLRGVGTMHGKPRATVCRSTISLDVLLGDAAKLGRDLNTRYGSKRKFSRDQQRPSLSRAKVQEGEIAGAERDCLKCFPKKPRGDWLIRVNGG